MLYMKACYIFLYSRNILCNILHISGNFSIYCRFNQTVNLKTMVVRKQNMQSFPKTNTSCALHKHFWVWKFAHIQYGLLLDRMILQIFRVTGIWNWWQSEIWMLHALHTYMHKSSYLRRKLRTEDRKSTRAVSDFF